MAYSCVNDLVNGVNSLLEGDLPKHDPASRYPASADHMNFCTLCKVFLLHGDRLVLIEYWPNIFAYSIHRDQLKDVHLLLADVSDVAAHHFREFRDPTSSLIFQKTPETMATDFYIRPLKIPFQHRGEVCVKSCTMCEARFSFDEALHMEMNGTTPMFCSLGCKVNHAREATRPDNAIA